MLALFRAAAARSLQVMRFMERVAARPAGRGRESAPRQRGDGSALPRNSGPPKKNHVAEGGR